MSVMDKVLHSMRERGHTLAEACASVGYVWQGVQQSRRTDTELDRAVRAAITANIGVVSDNISCSSERLRLHLAELDPEPRK